MNIKILTIVILSFLCISCASSSPEVEKSNTLNSSEIPIWLNDADFIYPQDAYITGLGHGKSLADAENSAKIALSSYMKQSVINNTVSRGTISITDKGMQEVYDVESEMLLSSSINNLVGVAIKERWYDSKEMYYALAVLDKEEAAGYYTDKIRNNIDIIKEHQTSAYANKDTIQGQSNLISAIEYANENEEYLSILATIDNDKRRLYEALSPSPASLLLEAKEYAKNITLKVEVNNDVNDSVRLQLLDTFHNLGIQAYDESSSSYPAYIFDCNLSFSDLPKQGNNYFIMYTLSGNLKDTRNDKTVLALNFTGRDGHVTKAQAIQRALATIETYLAGEFIEELSRLNEVK